MELENENRTNILQNALKLFSSKGYENTGVQEICQVSEITKPTLYYYFGNKVGILRAIISSIGSQYKIAISNAAEYNHDLIKHLETILRAQISFCLQFPEFFRLYVSSNAAPVQSEFFEEFKSFRNNIKIIYENLFIQSVKEFGNMKGWEKLYSKAFQSICESTALSVLNNELEISDQLIYHIIKSFIYGIVN